MAKFQDRIKFQAWWKSDPKDVHDAVFATFRKIDERQRYRQESNRKWLSSYNNQNLSSIAGSGYASDDSASRLKLNVTRAVIDASIAHIATNRPRPQFLTMDGNYSYQRKAKALNDFSAGQFYSGRLYEKALQVFRDACIFGTGFLKVYPDLEDGEVHIERVFPDEILVDDRDARNGDPRVLFQHKEVDRYVLRERFPDFADKLEYAEFSRETVFGENDETDSDMVSVIEAWHLPSGPESGDGRHIICASNCTLLDEEWDEECFPLVKFCHTEPTLGYYGSGLTEQLYEIQAEVNYLLQKIQHLMTLATSQVWVEQGTNVNVSHLNNEDWAVRTYAGKPPIFMNVQSVSAEYFAHLDRLYERAFEIAGISQLQAQSVKPRGLNSGAALREYTDTASRRFLHISNSWEQWHMDVADRMIDAARYLDNRLDGGYALVARGRNTVYNLDFKDIDLDKDKYVIRVFPTNMLPETPAGKMETIKEYAQVDPNLGQYLVRQLEFPDLESYVSLSNAPTDLCDMLMEQMLEHGKYQPPEPFMPLQQMHARMVHGLIRAEVNGAPEDRVDLVRQFLSETQDLMAAAQPPPSQPGPMPQGQQQAMPPSGPTQ